MFSWASIKEAFTVSQEDLTGFSKLSQFFTDTLPNPIPVSDPNLDITSLTKTNDTPFKPVTFVSNQRLRTHPAGSKLADEQAACEAVGNGDQFDHLVSLAATQDSSSKLRCGWVYDTQKPSNGRGAYGLMSGPFNTSAKGVWTWDLNAAQKKYHKSICDPITNCTDIDSSVYKARCGWNSAAGKAVPILNGSVAYPLDPLLSCPSDSLVTRGSSCIPPVPNTVVNSQGDLVPGPSPAGDCAPLPNGALSRACIIQKVVSAGCSADGTLAYALQGGSDSNYISALSQTKAYQIYQARATPALDPTSLQSGKLTTAQALDQFKQVNDLAAASQTAGLNYAARDLCYNKGALDSFDFCSELTPSTPGPFTLDCVQKAFLKMGGQRSGSFYPTDVTGYNNYARTWQDVLNIINSVVNRVTSSNRQEQEAAMSELYGINIEKKNGGPIPSSFTCRQGQSFGPVYIHQDYTLSFRITPTQIVPGVFTSIIHFTITNSDWGSPGCRSPAIYFFPGSLKMHCRIGDVSDLNWGFDIDGCVLNQPNDFQLTCSGPNVTWKLNGASGSASQPTKRLSGIGYAYGSNPWYTAAVASLANVSYVALPKSTATIKVTQASYGLNVRPSLAGNQTVKVGGLCDGKNSCDFDHTWNNFAGDPADGHAKSVNIKYSCSGSDTIRQFQSPLENGQSSTPISLNC